jgi:hypothetical protein
MVIYHSQAAPHHVMHMLNELYTKFDNLCMEMGVYKVETVVGGRQEGRDIAAAC